MSARRRQNQKWIILDDCGKVRGRIKKCCYGDVPPLARILFPDLENPGVVAFHALPHSSLEQATPRQRELASSLPWLTPERCVALGVPIDQICSTENECASTGGAQ